MFLTKLELHGFKSFPDRTTFEFDRGITAILGPNGCGKSNVVDAIKWVLGETSAKNLRGKDMQDVIFAGCESRKPMGFAEVSLWFDNRDNALAIPYPEVCVTRRLYRSGESEYLLNKTVVRRRDIRELFMGTGVATSAYSVIEQGRVEALLAAKPADRRAVFEEAAGVSKYKARRKETSARLERSSNYLARVNDIVGEVEKNIRRVSRQAQEAKRHQRLREELESLKRFTYVRRYRQESAVLGQVRKEIAEIAELAVREQAGMGERAQRLAQLAQYELDFATQAKSAEDRAFDLQRELGRIQADLADVRARREALETGAKEATERIDGLRQKVAQLADAEKAIERELETARQTAREAEAALAERLGSRSETVALAAAIEAEVDALRRKGIALAEERARRAAERAHAEESIANALERARIAGERLSTVATEEAALAAESASLRAQFEAAAAAATAANDALQALNEEERRHREEFDRRREEAQRLDQRLAARTARRSTLEDLEASFAGAFAGVKAVLEAKRNGRPELRGVVGMAVDLMTVPAESALAIETILGGSAQDVVVETSRDGQSAIEFLKRERAGRATFVPLDRIRPRRRLQRDFSHLPGVVGEAVDLVGFDPRYQRAMEYWLGGILVVETLSHARDISARDGGDFRIVTLEGEVINPNGAMTGGQGRDQRAGLVQRKAEMDALAVEIEGIRQDREKIAEYQKLALAAAEDARARRAPAEAEIAERLRVGRTAERDLAASDARHQALKAELERARHESGNVEDIRRSAAERVDAATSRLSELDREEAQLTRDTEDALARRSAAHAASEASAEAASGLRERNAVAAAAVAEQERRLQDARRDHDERQTELDNYVSIGYRAGSERESLDERNTTLQAREVEAQGELDKADAERGTFRERLAGLREELAAQREEERAAQFRSAQSDKALADLRVREQQAILKRENLAFKSREEIGLEDLEAHIAELEQAEAEAEAERRRAAEEREAAAREQDEDNAFANAFAGVSASDGASFRGEEAALADGAAVDAAHVAREQAAAATTEAAESDAPAMASMSDDQLDAAIADTASKLARIGPVNPCAIEELAELEAREAFLRSEQEDLQSAVDDLRSVIERLNEESGKRFNETFETVRANFQRLFTRIFNGGTADLIMEQLPPDENGEIPDPGIDIIARPPGKRAERISLLSGGEKALCAVALLFAIFESKPSPFCILDEVDGPLDESNIDLFMGQVREFSLHTQFILISHSKFTMGKTDTIYGVTQEERGVSRKYSWRFGGDATSDPKSPDQEDADAKAFDVTPPMEAVLPEPMEVVGA